MPRYLVLGNGNLLVCLDKFGQLRDLYFPYVGLFNHIMGNVCRIGLWDGEKCYWMDDNWRGEIGYEPDALVWFSHYKSPNGMEISSKSAVHPFSNIFLREFELKGEKEATLFFHNDFSLLETDVGDTAFYNPFLDAIIHFKRDIYILVSGVFPEGKISQYSIGTKGTWQDAEDGKLSMRSIEQGAVDSTFSINLQPYPPNNKALLWVAVGHSLEEVAKLHELARKKGNQLLMETYSYWNSWLRSFLPDFLDLPSDISELFRKSALIVRTNIDNGGAIIAANDSDIMQTARAHYSYMWGRDSAYTVMVLDELGQIDISRRFFSFIQKLLSKDLPFLWHKYSADGSLGSSWHPWVINGEREIPFQQDSTAIVIYALWRHYKKFGDIEFLSNIYPEVVKKPADFMSNYIDENLNLPRPSWDIWEERRGIHLYTSAITSLALFSASELASVMGDMESSKKFFNKAQQIWNGLRAFFENGNLCRSLLPSPSGWQRDSTPDASLFLLPLLNILPVPEEEFEPLLHEVERELWVKTKIGGLSRYKGDWYFRQCEDLENIPGNPWYICTMWLAEWYIEKAKSLEELKDCLKFFQWAKDYSLPTGIFPEQVHPLTGEPLSVAPLTWSHISFMSAVLHYLRKRRGFER
jgi:GH15 family glucan-1,4-alpha-glucosidase